jgi:hypothetical protein
MALLALGPAGIRVGILAQTAGGPGRARGPAGPPALCLLTGEYDYALRACASGHDGRRADTVRSVTRRQLRPGRGVLRQPVRQRLRGQRTGQRLRQPVVRQPVRGRLQQRLRQPVRQPVRGRLQQRLRQPVRQPVRGRVQRRVRRLLVRSAVGVRLRFQPGRQRECLERPGRATPAWAVPARAGPVRSGEH